MSSMCRALVSVFAIAYVAALALLVIGSFGLFGSPSGPLAGVFLIPLGMPWVLLGGSFPELLRPAAAVLAPLINILALAGICGAIRRSRMSGTPTQGDKP